MPGSVATLIACSSGTPTVAATLAELHVALADFTNPDKLHMWTPTQGAPMYQMALAKAFGLETSQVRIVYGNVGGAFTGRGRAFRAPGHPQGLFALNAACSIARPRSRTSWRVRAYT